MGVTVTTNLSLIKPDVDESIKQNLPTFNGWSSHNSSNCDIIDALFRASSHTYTLTWTGTSNPTLGTGGFLEGKYVRVSPRMVFGHFRMFTGGAGFAVGSGTYKFNTPSAATPAAELKTFDDNFTVGKAILLDADNVVTCQNMLVVYNIVADALFLRPSAGGTWNPTSPITIAQNDRVSGYFMYPTSDV